MMLERALYCLFGLMLFISSAAAQGPSLYLAANPNQASPNKVPVVRDGQTVRVHSDNRVDEVPPAEQQPTTLLAANTNLEANTNMGANSNAGPNTDSLSWELIQQLEVMKQEIARLSGKIEKQSRDFKRLDKGFQQGYEDLHQRLMDLENAAAQAALALPVSTVPVLVDDAAQANDADVEGEASVAPASSNAPLVVDLPDAKTADPEAYASEKKQYEAAKQLLKEI